MIDTKRSNNTKNIKYIFITGGVSSSLGKGLASASIACLLERRGFKISMLKMDPYINVDPGTMNPTQHGEVFVTEDGAETDLDLGHYERFTSLTLSKKSNFTTGQIYQQVINNERQGKYLGKTVQVVPHITDEIKSRIKLAAKGTDILFGEIGGTVGDIESLPFLEAIRQFSNDVGPENVLFIHLVLIPYLNAAGELKSKPAQHSIKELRSIGLFPSMVISRSDRQIDKEIIDKISLFGNIDIKKVFHSVDLDSIYKVPLSFYKQKIDIAIAEFFKMKVAKIDLQEFKKVVKAIDKPIGTIKIGIIGKYTELTESYKSLNEALNHAALNMSYSLEVEYIDADLLKTNLSLLRNVAGIVVPGGFGARGTEGKIIAIKFARENKIPFLGICLGMQLAVIEFARNIVGIKKANSAEFSSNISSKNNIIHYMQGQNEKLQKGGTMRLGAYSCTIENKTLARRIYKKKNISERHRHRLELNNIFLKTLKEHGLVISGINQEYNLVEMIELTNHPFFIASQFHPEFKSKPFLPHPLFLAFMQASLKENNKNKEK